MKELAICLLAAAGFSWPLIVRATSLGAQWTMLTVIGGTVAVAAVYSAISAAAPPNKSALLIGLAAGVVNGLGFVAYSAILAFKGVDVTKIVSVTTAAIPVITMLGAWAFFGEEPSTQKIAGITAIALGIYLLR